VCFDNAYGKPIAYSSLNSIGPIHASLRRRVVSTLLGADDAQQTRLDRPVQSPVQYNDLAIQHWNLAMDFKMIPQEMQDALAKFDTSSESFLNSFLATVDEQPAPDVIYHYTNDVGLRGILKTGRIWLTDIFHLNDPSELRHGVSIAVDILNRKAESGPAESKLFAKHFLEFFESGIQKTAHYFVCSFSKDGNDLGQWRSYADNGRGYALGFDAKALEGIFIKPNGTASTNCSTFHVTYDDDKLASMQDKVIDSMFELISLPRGKKLDSAIVGTYLKHLSISLSLFILRAALFFKHKAYKPESEFRFLQIFRCDLPAPDVKCRDRRVKPKM